MPPHTVLFSVPRESGRHLSLSLNETPYPPFRRLTIDFGPSIPFLAIEGTIPDLFVLFRDGHQMLADFLGLTATPSNDEPAEKGTGAGQKPARTVNFRNNVWEVG